MLISSREKLQLSVQNGNDLITIECLIKFYCLYQKKGRTESVMNICRCLPPDRTWHKVNDYSGDLGEGKVGNESKLEPCWSVLLIDPLSAMWVQWGK